MVDLERLSVADLKELCAKVEKVALQAGEKIAEQLSSLRKLNIKTKGLHDFVTNVDKASEQLIVPGLRHILPDVGILSEEGAGTPLSDGYNWIIDPLDGTTNFIHTMRACKGE